MKWYKTKTFHIARHGDCKEKHAICNTIAKERKISTKCTYLGEKKNRRSIQNVSNLFVCVFVYVYVASGLQFLFSLNVQRVCISKSYCFCFSQINYRFTSFCFYWWHPLAASPVSRHCSVHHIGIFVCRPVLIFENCTLTSHPLTSLRRHCQTHLQKVNPLYFQVIQPWQIVKF